MVVKRRKVDTENIHNSLNEITINNISSIIVEGVVMGGRKSAVGRLVRNGEYIVVKGKDKENKMEIQCSKCKKVYRVDKSGVYKDSTNPCSCFRKSRKGTFKRRCNIGNSAVGRLVRNGEYVVVSSYDSRDNTIEIQCSKCKKVYKLRRSGVYNNTANPCSCFRKIHYNTEYSGKSVIGREFGGGKYTVISRHGGDNKLDVRCNKCGKIYRVSSISVYRDSANPCKCDNVTYNSTVRNKLSDECEGVKTRSKYIGKYIRGGEYLVIGMIKHDLFIIQCTKCGNKYKVKKVHLMREDCNPCGCFRKIDIKEDRKDTLGRIINNGRYTVVSTVDKEGMIEIKCNSCGKIYKVRYKGIHGGNVNPCRCGIKSNNNVVG